MKSVQLFSFSKSLWWLKLCGIWSNLKLLNVMVPWLGFSSTYYIWLLILLLHFCNASILNTSIYKFTILIFVSGKAKGDRVVWVRSIKIWKAEFLSLSHYLKKQENAFYKVQAGIVSLRYQYILIWIFKNIIWIRYSP